MRLCLVLVTAALGRAELVDRIAATVDRDAITESALRLEIRITALLNAEEPRFDPEEKRRMLDRLIEQRLIRHEMEMSRYTVPEAEAGVHLQSWKKERFTNDGEYRKELERYRVREQDLLDRFRRQLATLRFLELRFRPGTQVQEADLRDYYDKRLTPEWQNKNSEPPPFEEVRGRIEEILIGERVDKALDGWLKEARARSRIEVREEVLR
jgi:hypothetical protein